MGGADHPDREVHGNRRNPKRNRHERRYGEKGQVADEKEGRHYNAIAGPVIDFKDPDTVTYIALKGEAKKGYQVLRVSEKFKKRH